MRILNLWICLPALLVLASCAKEEEPVNFRQILIDSTDDLYRLDVSSGGRFTSIGGYVWSRGVFVEGHSSDRECFVDSFSNKGLFDLLRTRDNRQIAVGTDGYFYSRQEGKPEWEFHRLANWDILHHVVETPRGFLASGGKSYEHGYIFIINDTYTIDTVLYFGHEISEILPLSENTYISIGWGTMQRSDDGGVTWRRLSPTGDFFASGLFQDALSGLVIGYNGTLYQTSNGGLAWKKRQIAGAGFDAFRKIRRTGEKEWWITGTKGRLWRSVDDGNTWMPMRIPIRSDIFDIAKLADGSYLLCGSDGLLAVCHW